MGIEFTQAVADHIQNKIQQRGKGLGLRLGITTTGCSGFAYEIDFADNAAENDAVFEAFGAKVFIDKKYLALVDGTKIDYQIEGINKKLVFDNPKATGMCGCGESFSIDAE